MNYQIQGLSIHAEEHGAGEPALVFLHYWGGTSRTWRQVTAELEGQFKTVAYDARGWGKSDKTLAGYKLADLADEALALVKALGIKKYVLVGHSMGGKVAQLAASRRPEGLSGLILVAPAQPTPRRNPEEMRQEQLHAYDNRENVLKTIGSGRLTARPPSPEILEQIVEDSMSGSHEATMAYAQHTRWSQYLRTSRPRSRISTFQRCYSRASSIRSIQSNGTRPKSWPTFRTPSSRSSRGAAT
jgi:3-oxoadipate enol-lactonase